MSTWTFGHTAQRLPLREQMFPIDVVNNTLHLSAMSIIRERVEGKTMTQVTRNIPLEQARDLLERVPRACIGFAGTSGAQSQPCTLRWQNERYFVGIPANAVMLPQNGQEVVLLVDEGIYFFDLRACYIRGQLVTSEQQASTTEVVWYELLPLKTVAWDYGELHEVRDAG
jgi:hypothetical protein